MVNSRQLGKAIAEARKKAGLSQDGLSDRAGLSYSTLAKIEQGNIKSPSVFTVMAIAKALNCSLDELLNPESSKPELESATSDIKFIYSDVNGVLVRFFQRAFVSLAHETGAKPEVIETTFWHYNEPCNKGEMSVAEFDAAMADRLGVEQVDWKKHYMDAIEPILTARDALEEISKQYPIGLLTNIMPGFVKEMIENKLLPDLNYTAIVDSSEVGAVKPESAIYEQAEKKSGFGGSQILFVDDDRSNLTKAEKFGWNVLWFDDYRPTESITRIKQVLGL